MNIAFTSRLNERNSSPLQRVGGKSWTPEVIENLINSVLRHVDIMLKKHLRESVNSRQYVTFLASDSRTILTKAVNNYLRQADFALNVGGGQKASLVQTYIVDLLEGRFYIPNPRTPDAHTYLTHNIHQGEIQAAVSDIERIIYPEG